MEIEEKIFEEQIKRGIFDDAKISFSKGLAQRAVTNGYKTLSANQQSILQPYLSIRCSGFTDPGDNHTECQRILEGYDLLEAYQSSDSSELLMCNNCISEGSHYSHYWKKMSEE